MNDDGCQIEQDTRYLVWMLLEVLSSQKTVKHDAGIREGNWLQQLGLDTPGIRCTSRPAGRARARKISDVQSDSQRNQQRNETDILERNMEEVHMSGVCHSPQLQPSSRIIWDTYICGHMILLLDPSAFRYMKLSPM